MTRMRTYRFPQPFRPWLYTIAHNLYKDHCKNIYARTTFPSPEPRRAEATEPVDLSGRIAERAEVLQALAELDPAHRDVLVLRYYQDLKVDEIARVLGVPSGTVKSRLFGAMEKLKHRLLDTPAARAERSERR